MNRLAAFSDQQAKRIFLSLILIELILVSIHVGSFLLDHPSWTIRQLFDLDLEYNIPAWFSATQLYTVGLLYVLTSRSAKENAAPTRIFLLLCGLLFIYLSMDEAARIHESITRLSRTLIKTIGSSEEPFNYAKIRGVWRFVYLPLGLLFCWINKANITAFGKTYPREAKIIALGFGVYLMGVAVLESFTFHGMRENSQSFLYQTEVVAEEFLEMLGISIILYGTLLFTNRSMKE